MWDYHGQDGISITANESSALPGTSTVEPPSFGIGGTLGLMWSEIVDAAHTSERLGFDSFYATDHLMGVAGFGRETGTLDAVALALALGPLTERIRLGCMVSPITMRHPVMLARALQTLDVITGGRAEIGIGAGWNQQEHDAFGFTFPPPRERLDMLAEAAAVIVKLWNADEPVTHRGMFPLKGAQLLPRAVQLPAPLLIGGASSKSVDIAAQWATHWNCNGPHAVVAGRIMELRRREKIYGRDGKVQAGIWLPVYITANAYESNELRERLRVSSTPGLAPPAERSFIGQPEELAEYVSQLRHIGVQRIIFSTPRPWSPGTLGIIAEALGIG